MLGFTWNTGYFDATKRPDLLISDHYLGDSHRDVHAGVVYTFYNRALRRCIRGEG